MTAASRAGIGARRATPRAPNLDDINRHHLLPLVLFTRDDDQWMHANANAACLAVYPDCRVRKSASLHVCQAELVALLTAPRAPAPACAAASSSLEPCHWIPRVLAPPGSLGGRPQNRTESPRTGPVEGCAMSEDVGPYPCMYYMQP